MRKYGNTYWPEKQIGNDPPEQFHPILWNLREFPGRVVVKQKNYLWRLGNEVSLPYVFRSIKTKKEEEEGKNLL